MTTAVFTFGRFQPPTTGHEVLVRGLIALAAAREGDAYVFVSSNQEKKLENPLTVAQKVGYMRKQYPSGVTIVNTTEEKCTNLTAIVEWLKAAGYTKIVMCVGSDRVPGFRRIFEKEGLVEVVPIGKKRNSGNSVAGMSGTKMRAAATRRNLDTFKQGVMIGSMTEENAAALMENVRAGMGLEGGQRSDLQRKRKTRRIRRY
jgi:nicotinic acid mononucleotide adenylyltransferase